VVKNKPLKAAAADQSSGFIVTHRAKADKSYFHSIGNLSGVMGEAMHHGTKLPHGIAADVSSNSRHTYGVTVVSFPATAVLFAAILSLMATND
jgi:hypothetical protein